MANITSEFKHNPQLTELDVISKYKESFEVFDAATKAESYLKMRTPGQTEYYPVTSNGDYSNKKLDTYKMELFISQSDVDYFFRRGFTSEVYNNENGYGRYISLRTDKYPSEDRVTGYNTTYKNADIEMSSIMSYPGSLFNKAGSSSAYIYGTIFDRYLIQTSTFTLEDLGGNSYRLRFDNDAYNIHDVYERQFDVTPFKLNTFNTFGIGSKTEERHPDKYNVVYVWTGLGVSNEDIFIKGNKHNKVYPTVNKDLYRVEWDACPTANSGYDIYRDGIKYTHVDTNYYEIPEAECNQRHAYSVQVSFNTTARLNDDLTELYAVDGNADKYGIYHANITFEAYKASDISNEVYLYKLDKPLNLQLDKYVSYNSVSIKWDNVNNATGYRINLDGNSGGISEFNEYRLINIGIGTHTVNITAITLNDEAIESDPSDDLTFTISKLATPEPYLADAYGNADPNGEYLSWKEYDTTINKPSGYIVNDSFTGEDIILNIIATKVYKIDSLSSNLDNGVHKFKIRAVVLNDNSEIIPEYSSDWSQEVEVNINTLATPNISFITDADGHLTSNITWDAITNADRYNIYVNDSLLTSVTENSYDGLNSSLGNIPNPNEKLIYKIQVKAVSDSIKLEDSDKSNIITYYVAKLMEPKITELSTAGLLKWDAITTPEITGSVVPEIKYEVYHNNVITDDSPVDGLEYQLNITPGLNKPNSAYIKALCSNQATVNPNPKYIKSDESDTATFGKFSKPYNLRAAADGYLYWDVNTNEEEFINQYIIYNNGEEYFTSSTKRFRIPIKVPQVFSFSIKIAAVEADNTGWNGINESDVSDSLTVIVSKLDSPTLSINSVDKYISWNFIDDADSYDVYLNGSVILNTTANRFSFKDLDYINEGINSFYVVCKSTNIYTLSSKPSNTVQYQASVMYDNYVRIKHNGILSKPMPIEMPLSIQEKRDDSLDTAVVTLLLNNRKDPYSPYTDIEISLADETGGTYKTWYMLVANDNVVEKPVGSKRLYSHTIQCIGRTRFLQTIIVPNMSITQPEDYIYKHYEYTGNKVIPNYGGNSVFTDRTAYVPHDSFGSRHFTTSGIDTTVIGEIQSSMKDSFRFTLPYSAATSIKSNVKRQQWAAIWGGNPKVYKSISTNITQRWFIRKHKDGEDQYSKFMNNPEAEIAHYTISDGSERPTFAFTDSAYYLANASTKYWDLILTIDDVADGAIIDNPDDKNDFSKRENVKLMNSTEMNEDVPGWVKKVSGSYGQYTRTKPNTSYRVVYSNIAVGTDIIVKPNDSITIEDALEKLCNICNNIKTTDTPKYSIDPVIKDLTHNMPCYQLKFEGRSLYECLEEIGREFFGVPYLIDDTNVISFHILDEANVVVTHGKGELRTTESSMDNCSTGFITDASNIISTNNVEVYPSGDMWITPRSTDPTTPFVTTENCGIVVDKPIAYLKDIQITGFDNGGTIVSIKPSVYEKSFYDALTADKNGKGSALYWQIGDNKIYGLGIIPELQNSKIQAALGISNSNYVIQNIIFFITGIKINTEKVKDLKFRVTYVPYSNTNVITEQFNTSDFERLSYKAYGQTDAIISDTAFGSATNKEIQRLGNNSVYKKLTIGDITQCPHIGDAVIINDELYYANVIDYEFMPTVLTCNIEYTKDYNKINERMGVDSDYRAYEIYNSDYVNRTVNINHYCYLSNNEDNDFNNSANKTGVWPLIVDNALKGTPIDTLGQFYINVYGNKNGTITPLTYTDFDGTTKTIDYGIALHATRLDMRNSILFTAKMEDNFAAGNKSNKDNVFQDMYANDYVRYVDEQGRVYAINIALGNPTVKQLYGDNYNNTAQYSYPKCNKITGDLKYKINDCVLNEIYLIDKDNREALTFTYQMHMKSDEKPYRLHKGLSKYLFKNSNEELEIGNAIVVGYKGVIKSKESIKYNKDDILGNVTTGYTDNGTLYIDNITTTPIHSYDGFAIVYDNGDIVLSYELPMKANEEVTLPRTYFNFKDKTTK